MPKFKDSNATFWVIFKHFTVFTVFENGWTRYPRRNHFELYSVHCVTYKIPISKQKLT